MKHILKKLHRGGSHEHPRTSQEGTTAPSIPSTSSSLGQTNAETNSSGEGNADRPDYFSSEEEFQVQLAMAISASNSERGENLRRKGQDEVQREDHQSTAESLSRQYWDYNVIDYNVKVIDGFYDIFGLPLHLSGSNMPSLSDIQSNIGDLGFEVIIVNRDIDPALVELEQISQCIALDCRLSGVELLVQRISDLVTEHMGGPVRDSNDMVARWVERSSELRTSLHTSLLPIGGIHIGLSRHRALLFKVLADHVGIPCKLVKGNHYTGFDDDAVDLIKLGDSEFLVDLMAAPGTLIPADALNVKDPSLNSSNTNVMKKSRSQRANEPISMPSSNEPGLQVSKFVGVSLGTEKSTSLPSSSTSGNSLSKELVNPVVTEGPLKNYSETSSPQEVEENVNSQTQSQDLLDSRNLFAELNPFLTTEPGNASLMRSTEIRKKEPQRQRENFPSGTGRPPLPLVWKNRSTCNDFSSNRQYDPVDGNFPRKNLQARDTTIASTSFLEGVQSEFPRYNVAGSMENYGSFLKDKGISSNSSHEGNGDHEEILHSDKPHQMKVKPQGSSSSEIGKNRVDRHGWMDAGSSSLLDHFITQQLDPRLDDVAECEILWEDLVIGERIGLGSYGEVYRADWKSKEVAVKKFLDQDFYGDALDEFRREVRIMRRLRHPNVVLFMGAVTRPPNLSIVTEFLPRGSLYRILHRSNSHIDEKRRIQMALDVAMGMNCLHISSPIIVHRDLKSPNLLVDINWNVKVGDFGLSRLKHNTFLSSKSTGGTPEWMAPEVLRNEPSNEKCDVYSFGVILWELATLKMPWSGMNPMQVVGAVGFQNRRLDIPKEVDPLVEQIIWQCWQTLKHKATSGGYQSE